MGSFAAVPCLVSAVGRLLPVVLPPHTSRDAGTLPASRTRAAHLYTGGGALPSYTMLRGGVGQFLGGWLAGLVFGWLFSEAKGAV